MADKIGVCMCASQCAWGSLSKLFMVLKVTELGCRVSFDMMAGSLNTILFQQKT